MFPFLFFEAAQARPPELALALGPAVSGGESTYGRFVSAAPATAATLTWRIGFLETWLGASSTLLLAGSGEDVLVASLFEGELGVGVGGARARRRRLRRPGVSRDNRKVVWSFYGSRAWMGPPHRGGGPGVRRPRHGQHGDGVDAARRAAARPRSRPGHRAATRAATRAC